MNKGYKQRNASPLADLLAFRKVVLYLLFITSLIPPNHCHLSIYKFDYFRSSHPPCAAPMNQVKARLGGRVRLIIAGGAPLSSEVEEFLRVTSCAFVCQGYGK